MLTHCRRRVLLLVGLLNYVSADLLPLEVTTVQLSFNSYVRGIINGPSENLIITDDHAVWSINIEVNPPTKHLIAGSNTADYAEGAGSEARFNMPSEMILMNDTEILLTDSWNHCLRMIDLETNSTSPYAGTCNSSGSNDDHRLNATFHTPLGILRLMEKIFICDWRNHAIRVLESDFVTTLYNRYPLIYPDSLATLNDGCLYATVDNGIAKIYPKNSPVIIELISGSINGGSADGTLAWSRYANPLGIAALNEHTLAVGTRNNRLRILDLRNDRVTTICSGVRDAIEYDGNGDSCSFNKTWGVHVYKEMILVGEKDGLASIPLYAIIDKSKKGMEIKTPKKMKISDEKITTPTITPASAYLSILSITLTLILLVIVAGVVFYMYRRRGTDLNISTEDRGTIISNPGNENPVYDEASVEKTPKFNYQPMRD